MRCFVLAAIVVIGPTPIGLHASEEVAPGGAFRAIIVTEPVHSREGIGVSEAISVLNAKSVKKLEDMFPNYRKNPASKTAAGWEAGHRVHFWFRNGTSIVVTVSENENAAYWSRGNGDFRTNGDFNALLKQLRAAAAR